MNGSEVEDFKMEEYKKVELDEMVERVSLCIDKISKIRAENIMLVDENDNMSEFLLNSGYTLEEVNNIAEGK